jgi:hypothetical protein
MSQAVKVEGLAEFSRNLKKLDSDLPKALRLALNSAADLVVGKARPSIPTSSGRAARSVRSRSTRTAVRVTGGGARAPYYPWLDFGGRVGRNKSIVRPFYKDGRYIYASYFQLKASGEFQEALETALLDVCRQAGVEVE